MGERASETAQHAYGPVDGRQTHTGTRTQPQRERPKRWRLTGRGRGPHLRRGVADLKRRANGPRAHLADQPPLLEVATLLVLVPITRAGCC